MKIRVMLFCAVLLLALCACGNAGNEPDYTLDLGNSTLYNQKELEDAALLIQMEFATWDGCELHSLRYAGDEHNSPENLSWLNELAEEREQELQFTQCAMFLSDFHSPVEEDDAGAWNHDFEYEDWQWWLGRTAEGEWVLVSWGY